MRDLFKKPYRSPHAGKGGLRLALFFGAFVFLFLFIFRPFSLPQANAGLFLVALGYGLVCTFTMAVLNMLVPAVAGGFFNEARWTVGREILWVLVNLAFIGLANLLYSAALGFIGLNLAGLLRFEAYTFLLGAIPVAMLVLANEARLAKRYRLGSLQINRDHAPAGPTIRNAPSAVEVVIPSENGKEDMHLALNELLFIRSAANYMEVFHGTPVRKQLVRGSLKRTEEAFAAHGRVLRCHKSHIVNLDRVARVSGNAQGFHLHFAATDETVPVSRSLNARIGDLLAARP